MEFRAPSVARAGPVIASDPRLDVESHDLASGVTLVLLPGALDADTATYLQESLAGPISRRPSRSVQILLNMAGVTFLDRVGLRRCSASSRRSPTRTARWSCWRCHRRSFDCYTKPNSTASPGCSRIPTRTPPILTEPD